MKKFVTSILATSAAAIGLFFAGATGASASTTYTVKSGDSVWGISQTFHTTINSIEQANHISNHLIMPGDKLTIPDGSTTSQTTATQPATTSQSTSAYNGNSQTSNYSGYNAQSTNTTANQTTSNTGSASYNGSNMKSYVLNQMASRTGVSASTWNAIITRESGWNAGVRNSSSGAYGLFQNMHINGGDVTAQVNAAVQLYHAQGMGAWAL